MRFFQRPVAFSRENKKSWTAATIFLAGMLSFNLAMAWNVRSLIRQGYPDFTIFYSAAKMVRQGMGAHLYDPALQFRVQQQFAGGVTIRQAALPYNHPPFEALLFVPFTLLPYLPAYLAWNACNFAMLLWLPWLLRPHIPVLRRSPTALWLASLAYFPIFIALLQGQDAILLLLLFASAFTAFKRNAHFLAGCWLALGLFRFHFVIPLLLILLWQQDKKQKLLLGFFSFAMLLTLVSAGITGWYGLWQYPNYVWHVEKTMRRTIPSDMPNLRGLLFAVGGATTGHWAVLVVAGVSLGLVVYVASRWKKHGYGAFNLGFSAALVATVLVSYHAFAYDMSFLILSALLLLDHCCHTEIPRRVMIYLLGPAALLFFTPLQMLLWLRTGALNLFSIVLLLWVFAIVHELTRDAQRQTGPELRPVALHSPLR